MFPLRDDNPTSRTPYITYILIGLNTLSWVFLQGLGLNPALTKSVCQFGAIAGELLGNVEPGTQIPVGNGLVCVLDGNPNWLTLITSMFMHGGWFHLIGNMWFLIIFGDNVEDVMGSFKFLVFYLLCGISAAFAQIMSTPSSTIPMVGASGAIGGVMGAYAILFPRAPVHLLVFLGFFITRIIVPAFFMLGYWFLLQIFGSFFTSETGGTAFWAHIGGFLAGILLLKVFCNTNRINECKQRRRVANSVIERYYR